MEKIKDVLSLVLVVSLMLACEKPREYAIDAADTETYIKADLDELLDRRNEWHGQQVEVTGVLVTGFEECALYRSRWAVWTRDHKEAFWLDFRKNFIPVMTEDEFEKLTNKTITVRGVLDSKHHGHIMQYAGTISDIVYIHE
ncbi:hypothetical protein SAMN05421823_107115 [Catalinimonas alkaloidigena]|uniref:Uncharacterized protein n=1 Tax=Catalinimonas alkaloidigena TaxID=1075417 RepID=A0A1G9LNP7_9BACT|nr:hypothetical protein [Catalinimonas alkaloidigena]SDL63599.1 hypothetical protein SAMN05421823_107115 [Catalinimonas alkaloidigena]